MTRSTTFIIEGDVNTQLRITEQENGTLAFEVEALGGARICDLRALFFNLSGPALPDGLGVSTLPDGPERGQAAAKVMDVRIGSVFSTLPGASSVCVEFAATGFGDCGIQIAGFTLAHDAMPLTLEMIGTDGFTLRYALAGDGHSGLAALSCPGVPVATPGQRPGSTPGLQDMIKGEALAQGIDIATDHGLVSVGSNGVITFTPNEDYSGPDSFSLSGGLGPSEDIMAVSSR